MSEAKQCVLADKAKNLLIITEHTRRDYDFLTVSEDCHKGKCTYCIVNDK